MRTFRSHNIPLRLVPVLVEAANHSLATNTHRSYKTAMNHIKRVEAATGHRLTFPFSVSSLLTYVGWLLEDRKVSAETVDKYLSGVRMAHMQRGFFSPWLKPEIVRTVITGAANKKQLKRRMEGKVGRRPITPELMKTIKLELKKMKMTTSRKRVIWLCATLCWAGAFRVHEILSREKTTFDPTSTLLLKDVTKAKVKVNGENINCLKVLLKHPKEERLSAGVIIDIFEAKGEGDWMCPVKAWDNWTKDKGFVPSATKPAIRLASGENYTGAQFNADLRRVLKDKVDYEKGAVTPHSFRAGLATFMSQE